MGNRLFQQFDDSNKWNHMDTCTHGFGGGNYYVPEIPFSQNHFNVFNQAYDRPHYQDCHESKMMMGKLPPQYWERDYYINTKNRDQMYLPNMNPETIRTRTIQLRDGTTTEAVEGQDENTGTFWTALPGTLDSLSGIFGSFTGNFAPADQTIINQQAAQDQKDSKTLLYVVLGAVVLLVAIVLFKGK